MTHKTIHEPDDVFLERIADMPPIEAEQECVLRREKNGLELAILKLEIAKITKRTGVKTKESSAIGVEMFQIMAQNTLLNERIKYLRRLMDKLQWKEAVRAIFGEDAIEQCIVWIEQQYGEQKCHST